MLSKMLFKPLYILPLQKNLLWRHIVQQHLQIVLIALRYAERPCGDIQKGHSASLRTVKIEGCKIVVLLLFKQLVAICYARRNQLCNTPLYQFFCHFRVFQLVADGYFETGADKFGKEVFQGVVREARHRNLFLHYAAAFGQGNAQYAAGRFGVIAVCFIEVSAAEQQQGFRMDSLHCEVLFHHRCH